jgi:hypothetical protein
MLFARALAWNVLLDRVFHQMFRGIKLKYVRLSRNKIPYGEGNTGGEEKEGWQEDEAKKGEVKDGKQPKHGRKA